VFLDINFPGKDGVSLATQLTMLPQPPRLVFTTGNADRATEAVSRLLGYIRPFEANARFGSPEGNRAATTATETCFKSAAALLPVKDVDRDTIRLLAQREIAVVLRRERRTWIHTVREKFATYYPLADLLRWLGGDPFMQIGRHAIVNLQAVETIIHYGDRLYCVRVRDRAGTEITASRSGAV
jgi:DNA-binding LytR/AlgR family response regulator